MHTPEHVLTFDEHYDEIVEHLKKRGVKIGVSQETIVAAAAAMTAAEINRLAIHKLAVALNDLATAPIMGIGRYDIQRLR